MNKHQNAHRKAERAPWGNFPKVIRNGDLGALTHEPEYQAAKHGDSKAALTLVERLMTDETIVQIKTLIGKETPRIVPVLAVEAGGNNKIPLAMAEVLADRLGLDVELDIVQREKVGRTGAGSDHRLAFNPTFDGKVSAGQKYIVVDDTLTMGGTLASLRGYIENRGGEVMAASVMTAHEGALDLAVKPKMLAGIQEKHGPAMDAFWKENFGYGIDHLTQGEAGHLKAAPSVDAIRDRIIAARHEGIKRLDAARTQAAPYGTRGAEQEIGHASLTAGLQDRASVLRVIEKNRSSLSLTARSYSKQDSVKQNQVQIAIDMLNRMETAVSGKSAEDRPDNISLTPSPDVSSGKKPSDQVAYGALELIKPSIQAVEHSGITVQHPLRQQWQSGMLHQTQHTHEKISR